MSSSRVELRQAQWSFLPKPDKEKQLVETCKGEEEKEFYGRGITLVQDRESRVCSLCALDN